MSDTPEEPKETVQDAALAFAAEAQKISAELMQVVCAEQERDAEATLTALMHVSAAIASSLVFAGKSDWSTVNHAVKNQYDVFCEHIKATTEEADEQPPKIIT